MRVDEEMVRDREVGKERIRVADSTERDKCDDRDDRLCSSIFIDIDEYLD